MNRWQKRLTKTIRHTRFLLSYAVFACCELLTASRVNAQAVKLEIHHININNGDASIIRAIHADGSETKVLIDGGQPGPGDYLVPYISTICSNSNFKYTILTHYHNDHYNGLMALGTGDIRTDYYIDLGGYNMTGSVSPGKLSLVQPNDITCPWTDSTGIFEGQMGDYINAIGTAADNFGLKRYMPMSKDTGHIKDMVGVIVPVDSFMAGTKKLPINLRCVAAWGFTQGNGTVEDNWRKGASKNDPCIAFVLECGEFRYFFGGDMGGQASGSYIDQETTLAEGLVYLYKGAKSYYKPGAAYDGHICGFKANHHGSNHSNNSTFLNQMRAAVCVTSAGDNGGWHLPSVPFIERLNETVPVTIASDIPQGPSFLKAQGFFFTNLYNFGGSNNSRTRATTLFSTRVKTAFGYGYMTDDEVTKRGYKVTLDFTNIDYSKKSSFVVSAIDSIYTAGPIIAVLGCHQK